MQWINLGNRVVRFEVLKANKADRNHLINTGDEILCDTESLAESVADFLEALGFNVRTGYYDPVEDERNGEVDEYTGWWYVDWD